MLWWMAKQVKSITVSKAVVNRVLNRQQVCSSRISHHNNGGGGL